MKRVSARSLLLLVTLAGTSALFAQETEKPEFLWISKETVIPEKIGQRMGSAMEMSKMAREHNITVGYLAYSRGFEFHWVSWFQSFGEMDGFMAEFQSFRNRVGLEKVQALEAKNIERIDHAMSRIAMTVPDLNYWPEKPVYAFNSEKPYFLHILVYKIKPGKMEAAKETGKKIVQLCKDNNEPLGHTVYEVLAGEDQPALFVAMIAENRDMFYEAMNKREENVGKKMNEELGEEGLKCLRGLEVIELNYHPDLSYVKSEE